MSRREVERLLLLVSVAVFLETLFYSVITPLLPQLSHQLHLSKLSAGVMTAAYPAGTVIGALPGGVLAVRRGPRFTLITGLLLVVVSTVGFALLRSAAGLDAARLLEGIGGACAWAGGLSWIVHATPPERRGAVMGRALGTSIAGALLGPAIGAVASATGRGVLFCSLAAVASLLLVPISRQQDVLALSEQPLSEVLRELRQPALTGAMWLMLLPALVSGMFNVLGPLQLHAFGAGAGLIGVVFLVGAGIEAVISPVVGRLSDDHGRMLPLRAGLAAVAVGLACFPLASSTLALVAVLVLTTVPLGVFWAPVMALLSDTAESHGIDQAHAAALTNLAWATGQLIGSAGGGASGKALGNAAPTLAVTALCLLTLAGLRRRAPAASRTGARRG